MSDSTPSDSTAFVEMCEQHLDKPEILSFRTDRQLAVSLRRHALIHEMDLSSLLRQLVRLGCEQRGIDTSWRSL
jgi:hypothetical protein